MIRARRPFTALYYLHRVTALFPGVFGCHPSARNGSTRFLVPPQPYIRRRRRRLRPRRPACQPPPRRHGGAECGCTCLPSWPPLYYHYRHRGLNVEAERDRVGGIFLLSPRAPGALHVARQRHVLPSARRRVCDAFLLAQGRARVATF